MSDSDSDNPASPPPAPRKKPRLRMARPDLFGDSARSASSEEGSSETGPVAASAPDEHIAGRPERRTSSRRDATDEKGDGFAKDKNVFEELDFLRKELDSLHNKIYSDCPTTGYDTYFPDSLNLRAYRAVQITLERIYKGMNFKETIRISPKTPISFALLVCGLYISRYIKVVESAFAQGSSFVPPLGLDQYVFTGIIIMISFLFVVLVSGLFWAGFIAKPKSQTAATIIQHLITFLSGALLGIKA